MAVGAVIAVGGYLLLAKALGVEPAFREFAYCAVGGAAAACVHDLRALVQRIPWSTRWAACYGGLLSILSLAAAGLGHGTYVIMGASSSPLGVFGEIPVALFGAPLIWGIAGGLASASTRLVPRIEFRVLMLLHYGAMPLILSDPNHFGDWDHARRALTTRGVLLWAVLYAAGQFLLWWTHVRAGLRNVARFSPTDS